MFVLFFCILTASTLFLVVGIILLLIRLLLKKSNRKLGRAVLVSLLIMVVSFAGAVWASLEESPSPNAESTMKVEESTSIVEASSVEEATPAEEAASIANINVNAEQHMEDIGSEDIRIENLRNILPQIGASDNDLRSLKRKDDWINGTRYSFDSHGRSLLVYFNSDDTVKNIRMGTDIDLYLQGYEPYLIENFLVEDAMKERLISRAKIDVSTYLNYPSASSFAIFDWGFGRNFDVYVVSSHVDAKNGFGVTEEIGFKAQYLAEGESLSLVYLYLGGNTVVDRMNTVNLPTRAEVEYDRPESSSLSENVFRLVDGSTGTYGEKVKLDSYEYFWYQIPAGTYRITNNTKWAKIYIDKDRITRNTEGYVEMENVLTLEMGYQDTKEFSIAEDEHIFMTMGGDVTLERIN